VTNHYQLSDQIEQILRRLDAFEDQVATVSSRLGVPFTSAAPGTAFDPRLTISADPRAADTVFDPMSAMLAPVPPPVPDPSPGAPPASAPADPRAAAITPEVIDLVRRGKKIHAIKLYKELTNTDLKTAKNVIDHL
jgi:hypothetical protein